MRPGWSNKRGVFVRTSGVSVNPDRLLSLVRFIVKGLICITGKSDWNRLIALTYTRWRPVASNISTESLLEMLPTA